jgi:hypothetical protein
VDKRKYNVGRESLNNTKDNAECLFLTRLENCKLTVSRLRVWFCKRSHSFELVPVELLGKSLV